MGRGATHAPENAPQADLPSIILRQGQIKFGRDQALLLRIIEGARLSHVHALDSLSRKVKLLQTCIDDLPSHYVHLEVQHVDVHIRMEPVSSHLQLLRGPSPCRPELAAIAHIRREQRLEFLGRVRGATSDGRRIELLPVHAKAKASMAAAPLEVHPAPIPVSLWHVAAHEAAVIQLVADIVLGLGHLPSSRFLTAETWLPVADLLVHTAVAFGDGIGLGASASHAAKPDDACSSVQHRVRRVLLMLLLPLR
mmetsp:Transcript_78092/g.203428  ORF Transcript_78092/g.203428 Transcript_78092/m.203428 type:complete len:252 (+) Transcript_78092:1285-2040(+)